MSAFIKTNTVFCILDTYFLLFQIRMTDGFALWVMLLCVHNSDTDIYIVQMCLEKIVSTVECPRGVHACAGTSSILAGAVLAAVYRCTGRSYDTSSLIHAVLHLEQILTTGQWGSSHHTVTSVHP